MRYLTITCALALLLGVAGLSIAADNPMVGTWQMVSESSAGENTSILTVKEESGKLTGTLRVGDNDYKLVDPSFDGGKFSFTVVVEQYTSTIETKVTGNKFEGTWKGNGVEGPVRGTKK